MFRIQRFPAVSRPRQRRRQVGASVPTEPVAGASAHWISAIGSMFQDTAGSSPVATAGDPVKRWEADAPAGAYANDSTWAGSYQVESGRDVLRLGTSRLTAGGTWTDAPAGARTYLFVIRPTTENKDLFIHASTNALTGKFGIGYASGNGPIFQMATNNYRRWAPVSTVISGALQVWTLAISGAGQADISGARLWFNGSELSVAETVDTDAPLAWDSIRFGGYRSFAGDLYEFLAYGSELSDADRVHNEQYLAGKYAITLAET